MGVHSRAARITHVNPYPDAALYLGTRKLLEDTEWYTEVVLSLNPREEELAKLVEDIQEDDDFDVGGNSSVMPPFDMVHAAQGVYSTVLYADSYSGKTWKVDPQPAPPPPSATDPLTALARISEPKNVLAEVMRMNVHYHAQKGIYAYPTVIIGRFV